MMNDWPVLLVGMDKLAQNRIASLLAERGYESLVANSAAEAADALSRNRFAFTLVDGTRGTGSLEPLTAHRQGAGPIVVVAGDESLDAANVPLALGADRIVLGPLTAHSLDTAIKAALSRVRQSDGLVPEDNAAAALRREIALWRSDRMRDVWRIIQQAAGVDVTVLISGETGTGKDLVARAIHQRSSRRRAPYVAVNCAAVPRDLLESELFGHERGAFTGAHQLQTGKFESADHGTIFLDEIGDLHPALQAKLLHVLQDGTFSRVGGKAAMKVDVRILAATNRDLALAVATERFRDDLYYRLNVIDIVVPPLRERREEIPLLAAYFVERYSKLYHRQDFQLTDEALDRLMQHSYPGNVRELENVIKRMIVLGDTALTKTSFPSQSVPGKDNGSSAARIPSAVRLKDIARKAAQRAEREEILKMLEQTRWNRSRTAKLLTISYRSLLYKMKEAGLDRRSPTTGVIG